MPNPKRKHTASRRDSRRAANWKIEPTNSSKCPQCGVAKLPHRICKACGFYNGALIIPKKEKKKVEGTEGKQ
ncbi:MAG: 50S ribosomal protein L32 [Elusimicrobia bacterium]|nr:50S ribosomal protein L32 [Elusimicrobiota bacterium]